MRKAAKKRNRESRPSFEERSVVVHDGEKSIHSFGREASFKAAT
jgi:hypothetical protein